MKKIHYLAVVMIALSAVPALGNPALLTGSAGDAQHSGGCRKDSPPGKCCHAGSKPYHCH